MGRHEIMRSQRSLSTRLLLDGVGMEQGVIKPELTTEQQDANLLGVIFLAGRVLFGSGSSTHSSRV